MTSRPSAPPPEISGFTYIRTLGQGGFADVFLYRQYSPHRLVAVKVLSAEMASSGPAFRLQKEADAMAGLSQHHNIVTVFQSGVADDGRHYIAMEYYPGPALSQGLRHRQHSLASVLSMGIQLAGAVESAHRMGVLHRDIKPANILMDRTGHPVLGDFGIALTNADSTTGAIQGISTPYSPPEAFEADPHPVPQSDVWSLAATVYALLAGRAPFEVLDGDNSPSAMIIRIQHDDYAPTGRPDVPESLDRVLAKALSKAPASRYSTMQAFGKALSDVEAELRLTQTPMDIVNTTSSVEILSYPGDPDHTTLMNVTRISDTAVGPDVMASRLEAPVKARQVRSTRRPHLWVIALLPVLLAVIVVTVVIASQTIGPTSSASLLPEPAPSAANVPSNATPQSSSPVERAVDFQRLCLDKVGDNVDVTGTVRIGHPTWGEVTVVACSRAGDWNTGRFYPHGVLVVDVAGVVRWSYMGVSMGFAMADPATDASGNVFFVYNPGRYDGVMIIRPSPNGIVTLAEASDQPSPGTYNFYGGILVGPDSSGLYQVNAYRNDCTPSCAAGTMTVRVFTWDGGKYIGGQETDSWKDSGTSSLQGDVKAAFKRLSSRGQVIEDMFFGDMFFNGPKMDGDTVSFGTNVYYHYSAFESVADLKAEVESVFTEGVAQERFYDSLDRDVPLFIDHDGKLFGLPGGGWGGPSIGDANTVQITGHAFGVVTFTALTYAPVTNEKGEQIITLNNYKMVKVAGSWRLDCLTDGELGPEVNK